jgi:hypothetical protein
MTATGWTNEDTERPALPVTGLLLSARAERGPVDPLERARAAADRPEGDPFDADERAANLVARGVAPGMLTDLGQRLADVEAEAAAERDKIARSARRQERIAREHAAGRITAFDIMSMGDADEGDVQRAEQLERRADLLRQQMGDAAALVAPRQELAADGVESASRHAHQLFREVTRSKMAAAEAGRPAPRPFGSASRSGVAVRSEQCVHCTADGVSDETSFLLHSDPELNVPVTPPPPPVGAVTYLPPAADGPTVGVPVTYPGGW